MLAPLTSRKSKPGAGFQFRGGHCRTHSRNVDQKLSWGSVVVSGGVVPEGILVAFWGNFMNTFFFFLFVGTARLPLYCGWGALPPQDPPQLRARKNVHQEVPSRHLETLEKESKLTK